MKSLVIVRIVGIVLALAGLASTVHGADAEPPAVAVPKRAVIQVPRAAIYPGDRITEGLISEQEFKGSPAYLGAVYLSPEGLIGGVARRTLLPGQPIPRDAVRAPYAVRQGQPVSIILEEPAIVMTTSGVALQAGGVGDTISVRNSESGRVIKARVRGEGSVEVAGP